MRTTALLEPSRPRNRLLSRAIRDKPRAFLAATTLALLPWAAVLAQTLPHTTQVRNWSSAWVGLDLLLAAGCGLTTILLHRNDPRAGLTAAAVAGVAVVDMWFDVVTSDPGAQLAQALVCAVGETALIAACMHIALTQLSELEPAVARITAQR
ncbi:hypothetical protein [Nocardia sp. NPDC049149]|uniref:hypothetical protein n=1 Tax=Nocardia sp. NPDC049149 TaxID=3364315 RepID=UPI003723621D